LCQSGLAGRADTQDRIHVVIHGKDRIGRDFEFKVPFRRGCDGPPGMLGGLPHLALPEPLNGLPRTGATVEIDGPGFPRFVWLQVFNRKAQEPVAPVGV
jgi:hypothetical protein